MIFYDKNFNQAAKFFETDLNFGLEEKKIIERQKKFGLNLIKEKKKSSLLKKFLSQFNDFMIIALLIAAGVSFAISFLNNQKDFFDPIIILVIVNINALIGAIQEVKAEKSVQELKKITTPHAKVLRDGVIKKILSQDIVPGDIIIIETGDYVSADARLISSTNLKIDESMLTGESMSVLKDANLILDENTLLGDRKNMVYSGSFVTSGHGKAIVTETGMQTQIGKIADLLINKDENITPLQKKLDNTGKILATGTLVICFLIFIIGLFQENSVLEMFMTCVSLAVAAIPEGLPATVTIVLAIGVMRMAKENAIVKKLPAVETLGRANIICSDKTGTLTENKMQVVETKNYLANNFDLIKYACLCNNAVLKKNEDGFDFLGDSTETALIAHAIKNNINKNELEKEFLRIKEIPFDSQRKLMTTANKYEKIYLVSTKGAPDILLSRCKYFGDLDTKLNLDLIKKIESDNKSLAQKALRVIAVAFKIKTELDRELESDLIFAGLFGMIDPPRQDVFEAIKKCKLAGIKIVMITGDHLLTGEAIAIKLGIMVKENNSMSGTELEKISEDELAKKILDYSVFARVAPEHKVKIINAFKKNNYIVAMTGDGVNDAPALKIADIGCAMGKSGTDVAKSAADLILTDDKFSTIVKAVYEGRNIYMNIKKAVHFLISTNIGEIISISMAIIFGWKSPLLAVHLLWVNLITDSFPAIALGLEPPKENLMRKNFFDKKSDGLFDKELWLRIILEGSMIGMLNLIAFAIGNIYFGLDIARTMAFATMSLAQLMHLFNIKDEKSIFKINLLDNIYIIWAFFICCFLQIGVIAFRPLNKIFSVRSLNFSQWQIVFCLSVLPILIVELEKFLISKFKNKKAI